jgi:hypothetical protein
MHEEDDLSDGAPLQAPRAPRNSHPRSAPNSRSTTKQRVFTRYEGIAIAAVRGLVTKEKPFVGMKRIVQYARDYKKDPGCARLRPMMKKAINAFSKRRTILTGLQSVDWPIHTVKRHSQRRISIPSPFPVTLHAAVPSPPNLRKSYQLREQTKMPFLRPTSV